MYNDYFGFKEPPFAIAPDPRYLYMTAQHRDALAHLVYGLNSEGGCILLTGEVGTGKTTICRCLLEQIPKQANVALLINPKVSEIELLETICDELKIDYPDSNNSAKTYTDRIYNYLIESNRKNEKTVLIIDEAQNLDSKVLEQLRLLTNLETDQRKLLQIIILGQPELLDILAKTEMRQLAQRITARYHLQPLTKNEVKAYVCHRIAVAGQNVQLFPEKSINLLYKLSNGIPRLINIICDRALLGAYVENQYAVDPPILKKAATEVFGELKNVEKNYKKKQWLYPAITFSYIVIASIALFFYLTADPDNNDVNVPQQTVSDIKNKPLSDLSENITTPIDTASMDLKSLENKNEDDIVRNDYTDIINQEKKQLVTAHFDHDNIDEILNDNANNKASAYLALFKIWDQNYNYSERPIINACQLAEQLSLSCLHKNGNLNILRAHNRPAVLTLINNQGEPRYVTIKSINNDLASVYSNNTEYTIKLSDLDKYWHGQFILLWQKPLHYSSSITPGDKGHIIDWLNTQLIKIDNKNISNINNDTYDDNLLEKIKKFQIQHGLIADGIVGPATIIHLNTQSGMYAPTLIPTPSSSLTKQG